EKRPIRVAVEIPKANEPGIAAEVGIQKINVATDESDCRNEKPAWKKEPERQRPGKVLKRKTVAQREDNNISAGDRGAEFQHIAIGTTQPCDQKRQGKGDEPAFLQEKKNRSAKGHRPILWHGDDRK